MPNTGRGTRFLLILVAAIAAAAGYRAWQGGAAPTPPVFEGTLPLADAQGIAAAEGKPVLLLATADWCGPCQRLKRDALADPAVAALISERTVPVYLDVTTGVPPEGAGLGIAGIPALIVLQDGREIARVEGYRSAAELSAWLEGL